MTGAVTRDFFVPRSSFTGLVDAISHKSMHMIWFCLTNKLPKMQVV